LHNPDAPAPRPHCQRNSFTFGKHSLTAIKKCGCRSRGQNPRAQICHSRCHFPVRGRFAHLVSRHYSRGQPPGLKSRLKLAIKARNSVLWVMSRSRTGRQARTNAARGNGPRHRSPIKEPCGDGPTSVIAVSSHISTTVPEPNSTFLRPCRGTQSDFLHGTAC
jgi:hypothetical protein